MDEDQSPGLNDPRSGQEPALGGARRVTQPAELRLIERLRPLLDSPSPAARLRAISLLAHTDAPEALDLLEGFLSSRDPALRRAAAWALAEQAARTLTPARRARIASLLSGLIEHLDPLIRREAAEGLGHVGDAEAIPLLDRLIEDRIEYLRSASARALGRIACRLEHLWAADSIAYRLAETLASDPDGLTRLAAARALGDLAPRVQDPAVRARVGEALRKGRRDRYGSVFGFSGERVSEVCEAALARMGEGGASRDG